MDRGYARVFGTEKVAFLLAFTLAGLNVSLARSHRRMVAAERKLASTPKRRKKRRVGTFDEVPGSAIDSSQALDDTEAVDGTAEALGNARSVEEDHPIDDADTTDRAPP